MRKLLLLPLAACGMAHDPTPIEVASSTYDLAVSGDRTCTVDGTSTVSCLGAPLPAPTDENGNPLPYTGIPPALHVAVGDQHACAAHVAGVSCWGDLGGDQPGGPVAVQGLDAVDRIVASGALNCAVHDGGSLDCWNGVTAPTHVQDGVSAVSLGGVRGCAIVGDGSVWCWGGQWGPGLVLDPGPAIDVAVGDDHVCWVYATGKVACEGENLDGESGDLAASEKCTTSPCTIGATVVPMPAASAVAVGAKHSCAITTDGVVYCWGSNEWSQLGRDDAYLRGGPEPVVGLPVVYQLAAGDGHTCGRTSAGDVYCWGKSYAFEDYTYE